MSSSNVSSNVSTSGWLLISGIIAVTIILAVVLYFATRKRPVAVSPGPNMAAPSPTNVYSGAPPRANNLATRTNL
jgi:hypothetical protein